MNSLSNGKHRKHCECNFSKNLFTCRNPIGNKLKFNFQGHCTLTFHVQMSACVFRSKECVNNTSVMKCLELNF